MNITELNKKLKFSWGHIIAFLALIYICYLTFMGVTYRTCGNMTLAVIVMVVVGFAQLIVFIGPQLLKGTDSRFDRSIFWERTLLILAPFVFVITMLPSCHFWNLHSNNDQFVQHFNSSINTSRQLFSDYESYSKQRIDNLKTAIGETDPSSKAEIDGLTLQLKSNNYEELKKSALSWIQKSQNHATTWNVFLLGNLRQIRGALTGWDAQLNTWSKHITTHEDKTKVKDFKNQSHSIEKAVKELDGLAQYYSVFNAPNAAGIINMIFCAVLMLFPYFLQRRDGRAQGIYSLFHRKNRLGQSLESDINLGTTTYNADDLGAKPVKQPEKPKGDDKDDFSELTSFNI